MIAVLDWQKCPSFALKVMQTIRWCAEGGTLKSSKITGTRGTTPAVETSVPLLLVAIHSFALFGIFVYAHGRRLCSNWVRHGNTTICYPQCSLTLMPERYLHRSFAYAKSAVGMDVVSVHKLFAYRVVSTVSTDIVSSHTKYCRIAYDITR